MVSLAKDRIGVCRFRILEANCVKQMRTFTDERIVLPPCAYCGTGTPTRDHVPSRVFLDKPYPSNLPTVHACRKCNNRFSLDEEYLACLVECAATGSVYPDEIQRAKITRILQRKPRLASRLTQAQRVRETGESLFTVEGERVRGIVLKLAKGHAALEFNEWQPHEPASVAFCPLPSMAPNTRERFENRPIYSLWPEVGTRAMQRLAEANREPGPGPAPWIIVQPGRYRYLTYVGTCLIVRIVIGEYLGCEVVWTGHEDSGFAVHVVSRLGS